MICCRQKGLAARPPSSKSAPRPQAVHLVLPRPLVPSPARSHSHQSFVSVPHDASSNSKNLLASPFFFRLPRAPFCSFFFKTFHPPTTRDQGIHPPTPTSFPIQTDRRKYGGGVRLQQAPGGFWAGPPPPPQGWARHPPLCPALLLGQQQQQQPPTPPRALQPVLRGRQHGPPNGRARGA